MSRAEPDLQTGNAAPVAANAVHPLFSPRQVALATLLGGPLGGGALMALNYQRLGQPGKAGAAITGCALALGGLVASLLARAGDLFVLLSFVALLAMPLLARSCQGVGYDRHVALGGRRASSWLAVAFGVIAFVTSLAAAVSAAAILIRVTQPDKLMVGSNTVFYADGVALAEARMVGEELEALARERGEQSTDSRWGIEVTRDRGRAVVAFLVLERKALDDDSLRAFYHGLAEPLSRTVYKGAPVDIWMVDGLLKPRVKLTWESRTTGRADH